MLIVGLTGGVASGKNLVANQFKQLKIPVFDADFQVHKLLENNQDIFQQIKQNFPGAIVDNKIDRKELGKEVFNDKNKLNALESIIYPILRKEEDKFVKSCQKEGHEMVILNIPLLFEKGGYKRCDKIIVVTAHESIRLQRFTNRFLEKHVNIDEDLIHKKFEQITSNQINSQEREEKADIVIDNNSTKDYTNKQITTALNLLLGKQLQSK
jgi:dephospho-CoA kinase